MGDEAVELCAEEKALKPLVPAGVTFCDDTEAADFWANSFPKEDNGINDCVSYKELTVQRAIEKESFYRSLKKTESAS